MNHLSMITDDSRTSNFMNQDPKDVAAVVYAYKEYKALASK